MIKISHRIKIHEYWQEPKKEKVFGKINTIVNLLNRCIYYTLSIPEGHYKCPDCDPKKVIIIDSQPESIFEFHDGLIFFYSLCNICNGKGCVDYVTNAMGRQDSQNRMREYIFAPCYLLQNPKLKAVSMIFYSLYYTDYLHDLDVEFSFNDDHDKKTVREFIDYFKKYKVERDNRKKFIDQNFTKLKYQVTRLTKLSNIPPRKIVCKECNGNPFDIVHDTYNDEIRIRFCGNCYGQGYQSKRDTKGIANYIFEVDYPYSPKYDSVEDMLYTIIKTAEVKRYCFAFKISGMIF